MKLKFIVTAFGALAAMCALTVPTEARADEPTIYAPFEYNTLRLEPGFALPLNSPQTDHYHTGAAISAKYDMHITPWVDVFPSATFVGLTIGDQYTSGGNVGVAWSFGLGVRVGRPHDYTNNTGHGWSAYSPWVDGQPTYVRSAELNRFGFQVATGVYFPTDDERWLWTGPFLGYLQITDGTSVGGTPGKDNTAAHIGIIGWGFEFGDRQKPKSQPVTQPEVRNDVPEAVVTMEPTPDQTPKVPEVRTINFHDKAPFKVQFEFDSAALTDAYQNKLNEMAREVLQYPDMKMVVEGYASDEGHPWAAEHNLKLSELRAQTVKNYLVSKGVPTDSLTVKGFGTANPIADNATAEGRAANRRVEFDVTVTLTCAEGQDCK